MKRAFTIAGAVLMVSLVWAWGSSPAKGKESYLKKADGEVQEWTAKLRSLQERSEKSGVKTREELDRQIKVIDEKLVVARRKLDDLRASSEGSWKNFRKGLDETLRDIKKDYRSAAALFNKKTSKEKS